MRHNQPQLTGFCFGILTLCFFTPCFAQQDNPVEKKQTLTQPAHEPIQLPIQLPILQLNEDRYILKGTIILQFAPGKVIEKEGVLDIQDPALKEACGELGITNLVLAPYQIKTKDQTITLPNVYRLSIPVESDVVQLCQSLAPIEGIQAAKPIYVNLNPKKVSSQILSNFPDFELWDFNPASEKDFTKVFASISLKSAALGKWMIVSDDTKNKEGVLIQTESKGEPEQTHFALLVPYEDHEVKMKVHMKARKEGNYQTGGIFYRMKDFNNYYQIELDFKNKKVLFTRMLKGVKEPLMMADVPLEIGKWYMVEVVNTGAWCLTFIDGVPYINQTDNNLWHGKVGLWTRADDSLVFDDYSVEAIKH